MEISQKDTRVRLKGFSLVKFDGKEMTHWKKKILLMCKSIVIFQKKKKIDKGGGRQAPLYSRRLLPNAGERQNSKKCNFGTTGGIFDLDKVYQCCLKPLDEVLFKNRAFNLKNTPKKLLFNYKGTKMTKSINPHKLSEPKTTSQEIKLAIPKTGTN